MTNWREAVASAHEPRLAVPGDDDPQRAVAAVSRPLPAHRGARIRGRRGAGSLLRLGQPDGARGSKRGPCSPRSRPRTSTIRLTTCVIADPAAQSRHPRATKRSRSTTSPAAGWSWASAPGSTIDPSYKMTGLPNWSNGERVARFGEYVELLDQLLVEGVTDYDGDVLPGEWGRDESRVRCRSHGCRSWSLRSGRR